MPDAELPGTERIDTRSPCGSNPDAPWLCVYTKPQAEVEALQHLRRQSFPVYLPLHVDANDRQKRIVPIFPRYLFAQPFQGSWSAILGTRGVSAVLRKPGGAAQTVPRRAVQRLLAQCAPNLVIYPQEPDEIHPGDRLRAKEGPFAELAGICTRTARDRVWILLGIMGREVEVELPLVAVEAV
jgi:transcription antitermination factor NusG